MDYPANPNDLEPFDLIAHIIAAWPKSPAPKKRQRRRDASQRRPNDLPTIPGVTWHAGAWYAKLGSTRKRAGSTREAFWKAVAMRCEWEEKQ